MTAATSPDWGDMPSDDHDASVDDDDQLHQMLAQTGLVDGGEPWPDPRPGPPPGPLEQARAELVDHPGQARRLACSFASPEQARRAAEVFVDTDPTAYAPRLPGSFEAVPVPASPEGTWGVLVRFLPAVPETSYPDFHTWVGEWLVPVVRRPLKASALWCPQWWRHPEAVLRLDALWRAWEASRAEGGTAMSYWWVMHFDSQFSALSDATRGPFASCKDGTHSAKLEALPCEPPPEDWRWVE